MYFILVKDFENIYFLIMVKLNLGLKYLYIYWNNELVCCYCYECECCVFNVSNLVLYIFILDNYLYYYVISCIFLSNMFFCMCGEKI